MKLGSRVRVRDAQRLAWRWCGAGTLFPGEAGAAVPREALHQVGHVAKLNHRAGRVGVIFPARPEVVVWFDLVILDELPDPPCPNCGHTGCMCSEAVRVDMRRRQTAFPFGGTQ